MMKNYRLGIYEKAMPNSLSLHEKLAFAKQVGFDFVEISIDETDEKLARLDDKQSLFYRGEDIYFETMCLSAHRKYPLGSENDATRERAIEIMRKAITLARDMGVRIIQIAGYDVYYEPSTARTKQLFWENLQESVEFAAAYGVILAFETMETDFLNTVGKCMNYVNRVNSPYLQVYPDTGNITNAAISGGTDAETDLRTGRGHLAALHLKESLPGKFRGVPFGTGHVDFERLISAARELGVRRYLGEFWDTGGEDWRDEISAAHEFLRGVIEDSDFQSQ